MPAQLRNVMDLGSIANMAIADAKIKQQERERNDPMRRLAQAAQLVGTGMDMYKAGQALSAQNEMQGHLEGLKQAQTLQRQIDQEVAQNPIVTESRNAQQKMSEAMAAGKKINPVEIKALQNKVHTELFKIEQKYQDSYSSMRQGLLKKYPNIYARGATELIPETLDVAGLRRYVNQGMATAAVVGMKAGVSDIGGMFQAMGIYDPDNPGHQKLIAQIDEVNARKEAVQAGRDLTMAKMGEFNQTKGLRRQEAQAGIDRTKALTEQTKVNTATATRQEDERAKLGGFTKKEITAIEMEAEAQTLKDRKALSKENRTAARKRADKILEENDIPYAQAYSQALGEITGTEQPKNAAAEEYLRDHPDLKDQFMEKFGYLPSWAK